MELQILLVRHALSCLSCFPPTFPPPPPISNLANLIASWMPLRCIYHYSLQTQSRFIPETSMHRGARGSSWPSNNTTSPGLGPGSRSGGFSPTAPSHLSTQQASTESSSLLSLGCTSSRHHSFAHGLLAVSSLAILLRSSLSTLAFLIPIPRCINRNRKGTAAAWSSATVVYAQPLPIAVLIGSIAADAAAPRLHRTKLLAADAAADCPGQMSTISTLYV